MEKQKLFINWTDYLQDCFALVARLRKEIPDIEKKIITGIPRGGLIPATILSHSLQARYMNLEQVIKDVDLNINIDDVIVIDDLVDTFTTYKLLQDKMIFNTRLFYVVYDKSDSQKFRNSVKKYSHDIWLVMPYEL